VEVLALPLQLVVAPVPRVVRALLQPLHLLLVVRLQLGHARALAPQLGVGVVQRAPLLRQAPLGLLGRRAVARHGAVQPLQLRVAVLQQLQVVPEVRRQLLELLPGLRQLRLLAA
jgi:hypothetical protein